jgi:hypothetical protein
MEVIGSILGIGSIVHSLIQAKTLKRSEETIQDERAIPKIWTISSLQSVYPTGSQDSN